MGKLLLLTFIMLEIIIVAYIVSNFLYNAFPISSVVFWIAVLIEIGLGYLTYYFWRRSTRGQEYRSDRIKALIMIALGIGLPAITYYSGLEILAPTGYSELFYISVTIGLFIYLSFRMKNLQIFQKNG